MEKELLQKKKEEVISLKNTLIRNENQIKKIEKENEQLIDQYTNISVQLDELDKIVFRYETLEITKKIAKVCFILAITGGIIVGFVAHFASALSIIRSIMLSIISIIALSSFGTFPYLVTKEGIKNKTNLTLEEVLKQIEDLKDYKKVNREKNKKNTEKIENIKFNTSFMYSNLNSLILNLLKDKEARDEIMDQIMEKEPSKELVEIVADNMLETNKIKTKTLNK